MSLIFTVLGSQYESARSSSNTKEVYDIASDHYYNSNWGYQNGEIRNANIGRSHQPVFTLNHSIKLVITQPGFLLYHIQQVSANRTKLVCC